MKYNTLIIILVAFVGVACRSNNCVCKNVVKTHQDTIEPLDTMSLLNICISNFETTSHFNSTDNCIFIDIQPQRSFYIVTLSYCPEEKYDTWLMDLWLGEKGHGSFYLKRNTKFYFIRNQENVFTSKDYDAFMNSGKVAESHVIVFDGINNGEVYLVCKNDYNVYKRYSTLEFSKLERRPHLKCPK